MENQGNQIADVEKTRKPESSCLLLFKTFKNIEIHKVFIENGSIKISSKSHYSTMALRMLTWKTMENQIADVEKTRKPKKAGLLVFKTFKIIEIR